MLLQLLKIKIFGSKKYKCWKRAVEDARNPKINYFYIIKLVSVAFYIRSIKITINFRLNENFIYSSYLITKIASLSLLNIKVAQNLNNSQNNYPSKCV